MPQSYLNFEESVPEKQTSWDEIQRDMGASDVNYDDAPITRQAGGSNEQVVRSVTDSLWAGSNTIDEQFELERHIRELTTEGLAFVEIEKSLMHYGYQKSKIRNVFHRVTGVDPVAAYLDVSTYSIPPDAVPRYNYGWGFGKGEDKSYYFILPFYNKYAVWKQSGLNKETIFEDMSLQNTREELEKHVKAVNLVTPDSADTHSDIVVRVASINVLSFDNPVANTIVSEAHRLKRLGESDLALKMAADAKQSGSITLDEHEKIVRYIQADDASEVTQEDRQHQKEFERYQQEQEGQTLDKAIEETKVPQTGFDEALDMQNQIDMQGLTNDAYDLMKELTSSVPGYKVTPQGQSVDILGVSGYSADESNHIDKGTIRFIITIEDLERNETAMGLVLMFINNGKLQYKGTFRGQNNQWYALSAPGVDSYFNDMGADSVEDLPYSPSQVPSQEANSPYRPS